MNALAFVITESEVIIDKTNNHRKRSPHETQKKVVIPSESPQGEVEGSQQIAEGFFHLPGMRFLHSG